MHGWQIVLRTTQNFDWFRIEGNFLNKEETYIGLSFPNSTLTPRVTELL